MFVCGLWSLLWFYRTFILAVELSLCLSAEAWRLSLGVFFGAMAFSFGLSSGVGACLRLALAGFCLAVLGLACLGRVTA